VTNNNWASRTKEV